MGMIYEELSLKEKAIERCQLALQLNPHNWRASLCLARVVASDEAVEILKRVINHQPRDLVWMQDPPHVEAVADVNFELGEQYWKMKQYDLAIPKYAASFEQCPRRIDRIYLVFVRYYLIEHWTAIASLIEQLTTVEDGKHLGDLVLRYGRARRIQKIIRDISTVLQQLDIVDAVYKSAIRTAEKTKNHQQLFLTRYYYGANLFNHPNRREDQVIRVWEAALKDDFPLSGEDPDYLLPGIYIGLGSIYLQRARLAKTKADPGSVADYLGRISDMVPEEVTQEKLFLPPQLYLARFHHVDGNEAKARQTVRNLVQVALELLSDDDEDNDIHAFAKLLYVFVPLGDTKNAAAALALMTFATRSSNDGETPKYHLNFDCTGKCKHIWNTPSAMWVCKECIAMFVEKECLEKLRQGKFEDSVCGPDHDFLEVPNWDGDRMDSLPKGMVPWGDENITLDQWKQEIRKAYIDLDA
jgi:tetratricopeptide (TPR) repeat protein